MCGICGLFLKNNLPRFTRDTRRKLKRNSHVLSFTGRKEIAERASGRRTRSHTTGTEHHRGHSVVWGKS